MDLDEDAAITAHWTSLAVKDRWLIKEYQDLMGETMAKALDRKIRWHLAEQHPRDAKGRFIRLQGTAVSA